jgi:hypothetical protein
MSNFFDYITWRGDLDFFQSRFNPVDNIIFSQLTYLPLDGIVPGPEEEEKEGVSISLLMKIFNEKMQNEPDFKSSIMYKDDPALVNALGSSNRFGNCRLFGYVNHIDTDREVQFSAVCIQTGDDSTFIAFRGTDFTLVGWKEDFNMSFKEVIPAQIEAVKYLEKMASITKGSLRVGGHSKGGNLAVYSSSNCDKKIQKRITEIYANDAPGFHEVVITSDGFAEIKDRIHSFVPQFTVVGMLLEHGYDYTVIKSSQVGLLQHDLYSWEVTHNNMALSNEVTIGSRFVDKTLKEWIGAVDKEHRELFFNALFAILASSDAKSLPELEKTWFKAMGRIFNSIGSIDEPTRQLIRNTMGELLNAAKRNIDAFLKPENGE